MTAVSEEWDVGSLLGCSVPQGIEGRFVDGLRDDCGPIISRVLEVIRTLTGRDLLLELLEPLAGDFQTVSAMQHGWLVMAEACVELEQNHRALAAQLEAAWCGRGADASIAALLASAAQHARQAEGARLFSDQLGHVVEVAELAAEVVASVLEFLDSIVQDVLTSAALGPAGLAKIAVRAPGKIRRAVHLIDRAVEAIDVLRDAVRTAIRMLRDLRALLDTANAWVGRANLAAHAEAGRHLGQTAAAGFR